MKVLKFGGSSVGNAVNIKKVAEIVSREAGPAIVVLSAMQGTTDKLIEAGRLAERGDSAADLLITEIRKVHFDTIDELLPTASADARGEIALLLDEVEKICRGVAMIGELSLRTLDALLSHGELLSSRIFAQYLSAAGVKNSWLDSRELIVTDSRFGSATPDLSRSSLRITDRFAEALDGIYIAPGFIAADAAGATTTLGRGGSDFTAAIYAAALGASVLEIWTDVSGMMSADPRFVRNVRHIPSITYREAMELSHFGAKVIYPPTIQPVMAKGIPVLIKNTFAPDDRGTLIEAEDPGKENIIRGISSIDSIAVLNLEGSGMVGVPGFSKRLFEALSRMGISVILITQSSSEHSICVAIEDRFAEAARDAVDAEFENEIAVGKVDPLRIEGGLSIIALVGDRMRSHTGVSGRMFSTLGDNGVNIRAIAQGSSERNISAIVSSADVRKAVNALHEEFFSDGVKQVNVFIAGVGTVGTRLLEQLEKQIRHIHNDLRLNIRVIGIANSRRALFGNEGIDLLAAKDALTAAPATSIEEFTSAILERNLRNSIFVDITASPDVVIEYPKLLRRSVSVIACNKIAASARLSSYSELKRLAREYSSNFLFETNVGAGLPVIRTLNDLVLSGDRIRRIEAVLSGTLNFVFNNYDGTRLFADVVRDAQAQGFTEPDPRLDLSGTDVARKILILARESGSPLEIEEIENTPFLPASCFEGSVDDFYAQLEANESHFAKLLSDAASKGEKLVYIASFDGEGAAVGLRSVSPDHDFASLAGKDNAVLFYTDRYPDQPLVVKGAGAGAEVTAAGVFADIIRAARQ